MINMNNGDFDITNDSLIPSILERTPEYYPTTINLNQAIGDYDLFTATDGAVVVEELILRCPAIIAGGALTSISVQTDTATAHTIISAALGAVGNLTSEAEITVTGAWLLEEGEKIQLTINGGAHGAAYACEVIADYNADVDGGSLA